MQSHGGQVRHLADIPRWCEDVTDSAGPARFARRSRLKAAVLGRRNEPDPSAPAVADGSAAALVYTVTGRIVDASPNLLVLSTDQGEQRFPLAAATKAWRGGPVSPAALRHGDHVIVRRSLPGGPVVDRIWAEVGRVTGTIIEREGPVTLLVDEGPAKGRKIVIIGARATGRIQVRFPLLEPGYLIDVIGLKHEGFLQALIPATSQPPYRADRPPTPPLISGHVPDPVSGTAVWHEPGDELAGLMGLGYAALDPETEAQPAGPRASGQVQPCVRLPYLSLGSAVRIKNECADRAAVLPVTSGSANARQFCDRCVTCGTSPRGRVADLTMAAFVELGGNLEEGCFNATLTLAN